MLHTALILLFISGCLTAPVDEPVRVDLPVFDQPREASDVKLAAPLELENHPGSSYEPVGNEPTLVGNLISHKVQAVNAVIGAKYSGGTDKPGGYGELTPQGETAVLETEGLGSKKLSVKENVHQIVAGIFQPKPIVDTITEEEKYGNSGDKFYTAGRAVVGGAESVSNLVNTVFEVPGSIIRKIARAATEKLNALGGKLIGL